MIGGYHPYFHEELERRVLKEKTEKALEIAGDICPDFAAYRYACGVLFGLDLALTFAEEIKKELDAA